jgi:kynurenine formamidase
MTKENPPRTVQASTAPLWAMLSRVQIRRVVDLSVPVDVATQVFPGDPTPTFTPAATLDRDGYRVLHVSMGTHTGTHVDAPYHVRPDGAAVDELPVELFFGPAVIADLRGLPPRAPIDAGQLDRGPWRSGVVAVLHTGWSAYRGTPAYFDHPYLTAAAVDVLLDRDVRVLALDTPSPDQTDLTRPGPAALPVHRQLADAGGVIVENLVALDQVDFPDPWLSVLPLRWVRADGAPCRAVALRISDLGGN